VNAASDTFRLRWEWDLPDGVASPELAATWARLEMWVGSDCVTRVEELGSGSTRRSLYGSLYPLAEWIAFNWWFLDANLRPASLGPRALSFDALGRNGDNRPSWLQHHNLRAVGEGFAWPNLTILPEGDVTRVVWRRDRTASSQSRVRFIGEGSALIERSSLERTLVELVEAVLTRLTEQGVSGSPLHEEWLAIQTMTSEERDFCLSAARLGLDPYAVDPSTSEAMEDVANSLEGPLLEEFFDSVAPQAIWPGFDWLQQSSQSIATWSGKQTEATEKLQTEVSHDLRPAGRSPWRIGWEQAREVREILGLEAVTPFGFDGLVSSLARAASQSGLQALGGTSPEGASALILGRRMGQKGTRFSEARALWHFIYESERDRFLLTPSSTERHKAERAFAAELLAPGEGIRQQLGDRIDGVSGEDLEEVADHFSASSLVVQHQVENQLAIDVLE